MDVTVGLEYFFDSLRTERADQLILQIFVAHVEAELLQLGTHEVCPEARALESPAGHPLLRGITETPEPQPIRP